MGDNPPTGKGQQSKKSRRGKRKRPFGESLSAAYENVSFSPLDSTGHPRSPHRFFKESYAVSFNTVKEDDGTSDVVLFPAEPLCQVVHHHVNGLAIVTAGRHLPEKLSILDIDIKTKEAASCSAAEKRKRQAKMLKGGNVEETVSPTTVLAELKVGSGEAIPIFACVWGTILELNKSLTVDTLCEDSVLDGYVAVILPSGPFPPKENMDIESHHAEEKGNQRTGKTGRTDATED